MSGHAQGWLLRLGGGLHAAIGARELLYVLPDEPQLHAIPLVPPHVPGVLVWENFIVPTLDCQLLLQVGDAAAAGTSTGLRSLRSIAAIVAMGNTTGAQASTGIGALLLVHVPEQIEVRDEQDCELPPALHAHRRFFSACFEHAEMGPVPILDLPRLFTAPSARSGHGPAMLNH